MKRSYSEVGLHRWLPILTLTITLGLLESARADLPTRDLGRLPTGPDPIGLPVLRCFPSATPQSAREATFVLYGSWDASVPQANRYAAPIEDFLLRSVLVDGTPEDRGPGTNSAIYFHQPNYGGYRLEIQRDSTESSNAPNASVVVTKRNLGSGREQVIARYPNCLHVRM